MNRPRRLAAAAAAAVVATSVGLIPSSAVAAPDTSLRGLVLTGSCPELKSVMVAPKTGFLFAPLRLIDTNFKSTGKWLFPYTVEVTGEGLKTRHMVPGVVYTRPGRAPKNPVTCVFAGATKEDGEFQVTMTGRILGW